MTGNGIAANETVTNGRAHSAPGTLPESPYSWNTSYVTADGFCCQLTIRSTDAGDLMGKVSKATAWLLEQGCAPADRYGNPTGQRAPAATNGNGNGHAGASAHGPEWCAVHGVEMKRFEKDGRSWYSHKAPDGSWCKGAAAKS